MDGSDLCFEIVRRAMAGFVYSEAVARWGWHRYGRRPILPYLSLFSQSLRAANHRSVALLPRQWYRAPRHQTACHSAGQQGELGTCEIGRVWLCGPVGRGSNYSAAAARYINSVFVDYAPTIDASCYLFSPDDGRTLSLSAPFVLFICFAAVPQCARWYFLPVICQMRLISVLFCKWSRVKRWFCPDWRLLLMGVQARLGNQQCQVAQDENYLCWN